LSPSNLGGRIKEIIEQIKQREKISNYETLQLRKDGKIINISLSFSPVYDLYGKLSVVSVIGRDITEKVEAEKALAEIEIARKQEIHHRIKNNLQVISSLLDLQAEKFENIKSIKYSDVLEAFKESQDRVISMALIHEELYKGGKFETLNFSQYIEDLSENLLHTYAVGTSDIRLKLDLTEDIFFDMDIAVPLGIIVNELVTNSLKHAFQERENGEIQIKLQREERESNHKKINEKFNGTTFKLTISDNGVGISENFDIEELDTLGIQLVTSLVDQLDGKFELKKDNGTKFSMWFTVK
jgi:two-component sensor histidine kinase